MKTLTVQEASSNLGELVQRALKGEAISIGLGASAVLLQPVPTNRTNGLNSLEALRELQARAKLSPTHAESYLREVHAERIAYDESKGQ